MFCMSGNPKVPAPPRYRIAKDFCQKSSQKPPSFLTSSPTDAFIPPICSCRAICGTLGIVFTPEKWWLEKPLAHLWKTPRFSCSLPASAAPPLFAQQDRKIFLHHLPSIRLFSSVFLSFSNVFLPFTSFWPCVFSGVQNQVKPIRESCSSIRLFVRMDISNQE